MALYEEVLDSLAQCPLSGNMFLPLDTLDDMITAEKVRASTDSTVNNALVEKVVQQAKKVFVCLIFVEHQSSIGDLLLEGLTDEQLPLLRRGRGRERYLLSDRTGNQTFKTFLSWKRADVDNFLEKQWRVQAPVFDTSGSHFVLDRECALPLHTDCKKIGTTDISNVFQCKLYQAHYQQGSKAHATQVDVAVKELRNRDNFARERDNLTKILNLNNRHLIKHFATCEIGSNYYVIFPLANGGSLLDYWKRENKKPRGLQLILWALQQIHGLAGAIYALHHDLGGDIHCRHGDLKPANILLFEENTDRFLVIADLGVSRFHEQQTDLRRGGTTTMATTRSYEAPEVLEPARQDQPRPRTYDIWSLGCVFLEFAIWLLYDFDAVKNFEENRKRPHENPHASFFQMTTSGKAEISPEVLDAVKALREDPRCRGGTSLESLVNLIADKLLITAAEDRCKAEQLRDELQEIVQKAQQDLSYLLNPTSQPPPIHKVFLPVKGSKTW